MSRFWGDEPPYDLEHVNLICWGAWGRMMEWCRDRAVEVWKWMREDHDANRDRW